MESLVHHNGETRESAAPTAQAVPSRTQKSKAFSRKKGLLESDDAASDRRDSQDGDVKPKNPIKTEKRASKGTSIQAVPTPRPSLAHSSSDGCLHHGSNGTAYLQQRQRGTLLSPLSSSMDSYASTTDDKDLTTRISGSNQRMTSPSESSVGVHMRASGLRNSVDAAIKSPLSLPQLSPPTLALVEEEWDYSATARWGWVILFFTWIAFVVGMGSCLGIWSWAWDVGETPHAPPELEDDPTLPIVGYYPALIVLTAVMSWVWVVVAWVGMKYFKHAKMQGDDT